MTSDRSYRADGEGADEQALRGSIGPRLRRLRKERGMTMIVLAASAQCSQSFLSKVETGSLLPSLPMLQRIARALQVDMRVLLDDTVADPR